MAKKKIGRTLFLAGISGIIGILIGMIAGVLDLLGYFGMIMNFPLINLIIQYVGVVFGLIFLWGFFLLARATKNSLLAVSSIMIMVVSFIAPLLDLIVVESVKLLVSAGFLFTFGISMVLFGIGLLPLKKQFKELATAAGVLEMIAGVCFVTVFLSFLGLLPSLIAFVLEVMILFAAAKKY